MALPSSGIIKMSDLATEFQDTVPYKLSDYYRGGSLVPNASVNSNVPTSGVVRLSNFYSATRRIAVTITISSNSTNYTLNTSAVPGYVAGVMDITFVVNSGVSLYSTSTATAALAITGFTAGDIITINNNGTIYGAGGAGGRNNSCGYDQEAGNTDGAGYGGDVPDNPCGQNGPAVGGSSGSAGGPAIDINLSNILINIYNYGTVTGGGGGGGGGGGNNVGGGSGGNGGVGISKGVSFGGAAVVLYNQSGAVFAGGGGGGAGWGNRSAGATEGGTPGNPGVITVNGGGNFGAQGSAGAVITGSATTLYNTPGVFALN